MKEILKESEDKRVRLVRETVEFNEALDPFVIVTYSVEARFLRFFHVTVKEWSYAYCLCGGCDRCEDDDMCALESNELYDNIVNPYKV